MFGKIKSILKSGVNVADDLLGDIDEQVLSAAKKVLGNELKEILASAKAILEKYEDAKADGEIDPKEAIEILEKIVELGIKLGL
jgi:hypothetical protein